MSEIAQEEAQTLELRNKMLALATTKILSSDTYDIINWEYRASKNESNIVFAFDEDWCIDDICIAIINVPQKSISLNIFHDNDMDILNFDISTFNDEQVATIYQHWVSNDLNFIAVSGNEDDDDACLMLPTKIVQKH